MGHIIDTLIALSVPSLVLLYLSLAPYTKIEESFTIQATHDILSYGIPFRDRDHYLAATYDHVKHPELHPVPRTFLAPLLFAIASSPFARFVKGVDTQILVRAILGLYNAFCILTFRNSIQKAFGSGTANWYIIFQVVQFHVIFYASRTLPNIIPFGLSTVALGYLLPTPSSTLTNSTSSKFQLHPSLVLLTILGIVFRSELALLLGVHTIYSFLRGQLSIPRVLISGTFGLAIGLLLTVPLDTYFWQTPLWPELSSFLFNIYSGKSSDWGTSPWHYYFTSSLPKLLFNPLLPLCVAFSLFTPALRSPSLTLLLPNLAYIALYSFVPHKEWRFILYTLPPLTAAGSLGANYIWTRRSKTPLYRLLSLILILSTISSLGASVLMALISSTNYPGAQALNTLHALADGTKPVLNVHIDVLTAQTGATKFLEIPAPRNGLEAIGRTVWRYDKSDVKSANGGQLLDPVFWEGFDYALAEKLERVIGAWDVLATVKGYGGVKVVKPGEEVDGGEMDVGEGWAREAVARRGGRFGAGPWDGWMRVGKRGWNGVGGWMRRVTGGWWVDVRMVPVIHVLRRVPMGEVRGEIAKEGV